MNMKKIEDMTRKELYVYLRDKMNVRGHSRASRDELLQLAQDSEQQITYVDVSTEEFQTMLYNTVVKEVSSRLGLPVQLQKAS